MRIKFGLLLILFFTVSSCSKKKPASTLNEAAYIETPYDTTAIDSFSSGAVSVDVARQIRMSSKKYLDSVKKAKDSMKLVFQIQEEERKKKEAEEKIKKETEEKTDVSKTQNEKTDKKD